MQTYAYWIFLHIGPTVAMEGQMWAKVGVQSVELQPALWHDHVTVPSLPGETLSAEALKAVPASDSALLLVSFFFFFLFLCLPL